MLNWIIQQTENIFGCTAFCGSVDDTEQTTVRTDPLRKMGSRFVKNVWSELELETSTFDNSVGGSTASSSADGDDNDSKQSCDANDKEASSVVSCREPQEQGSNIPVLRQLPSFGSNLATNSLPSFDHNTFHRSSTGMSSYSTTRQTSMDDSVTRRKFSLLRNMALGGTEEEEESSVVLKSSSSKAPSPPETSFAAPTDSFIFLRQ